MDAHGDGLPVKAVTTLQNRSVLKGLAVGALVSVALGQAWRISPMRHSPGWTPR